MFRIALRTNHSNLSHSTLPSIEMVRLLISLFLSTEATRTDARIRPCEEAIENACTELLISLMVVGCLQSSEPVLWALGLALQELNRLAIAAKVGLHFPSRLNFISCFFAV